MHGIFNAIDVDKSRTISIEEFFRFFEYVCVQIRRAHAHDINISFCSDKYTQCRYQFVTPLARRIFELFDEDCSGELSFEEFIFSVWNYLTLTAMNVTDLSK